MKVRILRGCVSEGGKTLAGGDIVELKESTARAMCWTGQAEPYVERAQLDTEPEPEPAPEIEAAAEPEPEPEPPAETLTPKGKRARAEK